MPSVFRQPLRHHYCVFFIFLNRTLQYHNVSEAMASVFKGEWSLKSKDIKILHRAGDLAQHPNHLPGKPEVGGSIPINKKKLFLS